MKEFKELFPSAKYHKLLQFKALGYFIVLADRYLDSSGTPHEIRPGIKILYNGETVMIHYQESLYLFTYEYNKDKSNRTSWKDCIIPKFCIDSLSSDLRKQTTTELRDLLAFSVYRAERDIDKELGVLNHFVFMLEVFIFTTFTKKIGSNYDCLVGARDSEGKTYMYQADIMNFSTISGSNYYKASRLYECESIEILSIFNPLIEDIQKYPEVYELLPISNTYIRFVE